MVGPTEEQWTTIARTDAYGGRVRVARHEVELPGGVRTDFEVDESHPFVVGVLVIEGETVVLAREYRYPIRRWIHGLPGGAGDAGESPADAAARECREELGLNPLGLEPLYIYFPNPGRAEWPMHLFVCRATADADPDHSDPSEDVRRAILSVAELDVLIRAGGIVDPALLIARSIAGARGILPALGEATLAP